VEFNEEQILRYSRHIILPEVGGRGQARLLQGSALVIGAGGLGSPSAFYLAAAGVGRLGLVDSDVVDISNLQRQILHATPDVGRAKVESAREKLSALNPDVEIIACRERLTSENILDIIRPYDVVLDGSDNFPTRYLVNDACVMVGKPLCHASIFRFEGQATTIIPGEGPCYRCLFPAPPPPGLVPSCQEAGILGAIAGVLGTIQAVEALKVLLGKGDLLVNRLLLVNALDMQFRTIRIRRDPDCRVCSDHPAVTELIDYEEFCSLRR